MPAPTLIAEATRRCGVVWVSAPGGPARLVWHLWHEDALYLVGGGDEQELPSFGAGDGPGDGAGRAHVVVRSRASQSGRVVEWDAAVEPVLPGTAGWEEVVPLLAAERLNATEAADLAARWAQDSTVLRLTPLDDAPGPTRGRLAPTG